VRSGDGLIRGRESLIGNHRPVTKEFQVTVMAGEPILDGVHLRVNV